MEGDWTELKKAMSELWVGVRVAGAFCDVIKCSLHYLAGQNHMQPLWGAAIF